MSTATALFAMQSTQFEQRAAGSLKIAMRTKYIAEAATVGAQAFCLEYGVSCADMKLSPSNFSSAKRIKYGLPDYGTAEPVSELGTGSANGTSSGLGDLAGANWPLAGDLLPTDTALITNGGAASPYTPDFVTVMEKWKVPNPSDSRPRFRLVVSTYGLLMPTVDVGAALPAGESRYGHESVSATRAFFDVE
jgi:hypothetical protein